jgi:cyanophycin synthetase
MINLSTKSQHLFEHFIKRFHLPSSLICYASIIQEALNRNLSVEILGFDEATEHGLVFSDLKGISYGNIFTVSDGLKKMVFNKSMCWEAGANPPLPPKSKNTFKEILKSLKVGYAEGFLIDSSNRELLSNIASKLSYPLVLKPDKGSMGKGVFVGLKNEIELLNAVSTFSTKRTLLLEKLVSGDEYRVYTIGGHFVCALKRLPPKVVGDGVRSLTELIEAKNQIRSKMRFGKIKFDGQSELAIRRVGLSYNSVPAKGRSVVLGMRLGRSSGGDIELANTDFDNSKRVELETLAKYFSTCNIMGIDVILADNKLIVIEANFRPQLSSALLPDSGESTNIPRLLLTHLFPESKLRPDFKLFNYNQLRYFLKKEGGKSFTFPKLQ